MAASSGRMRDVVEIDPDLCDGCGQCASACAEGAIAIIDGKATLVSDVYCDGLGACLGHCPRGAISIVRRPAAEFSADAANARLAALGHGNHHPPQHQCPQHQCPGTMHRQLVRLAEAPKSGEVPTSQLGHWPLQLALVNPAAPWLAGADILLTSQCAAAAAPDLHQRWLRGRAVLLACPKLDDIDAHTEKLAEIISVAQPRSLTVLRMEVPCCGGLVAAAHRAVELVGSDLEVTAVVVNIDGTYQE
eukprot:TRINITY_DN5424_c0_g1_i1.p1 TRINITY_DN5424_c0_g1~~TRINITY_DN5424_c0_g1_i1.p1  ORF type:complete len:266 (+),score=76.20 TRINITY_DN5424_c0_g1_i1:58-798(+)